MYGNMEYKAALYIRVSTEDQTEYSPAAQRKLLIDYAKKNGMKVMPQYIFVDEGFSGRNADKRPKFMQMIGTAKSKPKPFDVILVHKFDRFARNREDSIVYKSMLQKEHGIKVISITESIDDSPMSILLEAMLEAMAEYYSINLSKEVKKGMTEKAEQGGYQTTPPLGYTMGDNNVLIASEQEARHIQYIFTQYVHQDRSPYQIAKQLNMMGVKSKRGNAMDGRGVEYILQNPVYIGTVRWTPTEKVRRNFDHPDTIKKKGKHEPIISEELFQSAAEKLSETKKKRKPRARPLTECKHWLSGLVKCASCGNTLSLSSGLKAPSFQCGGYSHGKCAVSHSITKRKLEQAILEEMNKALEGGDITEFQMNISHIDTSRQEIDQLRNQILKIENSQARAKEAYLYQIDTLDEYKRNKETLELKRQYLENEIRNLEDNRPVTIDTGLKDKLRNAVDVLISDYDVYTKQKAIRSIIEKITYDKPNESLEVYYYDM